jgi:hypothetical protein
MKLYAELQKHLKHNYATWSSCTHTTGNYCFWHRELYWHLCQEQQPLSEALTALLFVFFRPSFPSLFSILILSFSFPNQFSSLFQLHLLFLLLHVFNPSVLIVARVGPLQWSSTWDTCTPRDTWRHLRGYTKTSYGVCKIEKKNYW